MRQKDGHHFKFGLGLRHFSPLLINVLIVHFFSEVAQAVLWNQSADSVFDESLAPQELDHVEIVTELLASFIPELIAATSLAAATDALKVLLDGIRFPSNFFLGVVCCRFVELSSNEVF